MSAYRSAVQTARAVSGSGALSSTVVPSQVWPSSDSSGPYATSSSPSSGRARAVAGPSPRPSTRDRFATGSATGEIPHGAPQHVTVRVGLVVGLVEGERAGGGRIGQVDDVQAAGGCFTVIGEGRAASDQLLRVPVHVGPVQLLAYREGAGPITVTAEELHDHRPFPIKGTISTGFWQR